MKFNLLNENKLQIIISQNDLKSRNLKKWDLVPYNPNAQALFQEILEHANEACGFEVMRDTQLMVEAYPISGDSMIMTITKLAHQDDLSAMDLEHTPHRQGNMLQEFLDLLQQKEYVVYEMTDLEDVIEVSHVLISRYEKDSALYKGPEGNYYLVLEDVDQLKPEATGHLIEYAQPTAYSKAFLNEHTTCIIPEHAVNHLGTI